MPLDPSIVSGQSSQPWVYLAALAIIVLGNIVNSWLSHSQGSKTLNGTLPRIMDSIDRANATATEVAKEVVNPKEDTKSTGA